MAFSEMLQRKLNKRYEPHALLHSSFRGNDITIKTNEQGYAVLLFIGKKDSSGKIKGQRYTRTLIVNEAGEHVKDHWDLKGKA